MKKLFLTSSVLIFAASASFAVTASSDPDNPTSIKNDADYGEKFTGTVVWNGSGSYISNELSQTYLLLDTDASLSNFLVSGTNGFHSVMNMSLEAGKTLDFSSENPFNFNNTPEADKPNTTYYSSHFVFQMQGTASDTNKANINFNNESGTTFDLYTLDTDSGKNQLASAFGRKVSIGAGITATFAGGLKINGRNARDGVALTSEKDSIFISNGALVSDKIEINGANAQITGTWNAKSESATQTDLTFGTYQVHETVAPQTESYLKTGYTTLQNTAIEVLDGATATIDFKSLSSSSDVAKFDKKVVVKGTLNVITNKGSYGPSINLKEVEVDGGTVVETAQNGAYAFAATGEGSTVVVKNGGTIKMGNKNAFLSVLNGGTLTVLDATSKIDASQIAFFGQTGGSTGTTSTMNFASASNLSQKSAIMLNGSGTNLANGVINLNSKTKEIYEFGNVDFLRNSNLTVDLNGNEVHFGKVGLFSNHNAGCVSELILKDFLNGLVKLDADQNTVLADGTIVQSKTNASVIIKAYDSNDNLIVGDWSLVDGVLTNSGAATIPEPAEWAAIFGALALALAIYRRRK